MHPFSGSPFSYHNGPPAPAPGQPPPFDIPPTLEYDYSFNYPVPPAALPVPAPPPPPTANSNPPSVASANAPAKPPVPMGQPTQPSGDGGNFPRTACLECRSKHLKCDFKLPRCTRCRESNLDCRYVKSRRGYRGPRKADTQNAMTKATPRKLITNPDQGSDYSLPNVYSETPDTVSVDTNVPFQPRFTGNFQIGSMPPSPLSLPSFSSPNNGTNISQSGLYQLFFRHFHRSHPIVLPAACLWQHMQKHPCKQLDAVIQYIGSIYSPHVETSTYLDMVNDALYVQPQVRDGFTVQALLLFAVASFAVNEQIRCMQVLESACELAVEIGMHKREFATRNGGSSILEESWRRTWWELYVIGGILACISQKDTFRLQHVEADVDLPCEEDLYQANTIIPTPATLDEFNVRAFAPEEVIYSSFAYRIDTVRILGDVIGICHKNFEPTTEQIDACDASLTNWAFHLPLCKTKVVDAQGNVDEMLFQANMFVNGALMTLHRNRSNLGFAPAYGETMCTGSIRSLNPARTSELHTIKAINAADAVCGLIKLPGPLSNHTPMFACCIALGAVVHLAAYSLNPNGSEGTALKLRLQLSIGALNQLKETWPVAIQVMQEIKAASRDTFDLLESCTSDSSVGAISEPLPPLLDNRQLQNEFDAMFATSMASTNTFDSESFNHMGGSFSYSG